MTDKVKGPEYDKECRSLLHQFELSQQSIQSFQGLDKFVAEYGLVHCQSATRRIKEGKSGYKGEDTDKNLAVRVMDITSKIISAMDILEMNLNSVD